MAAKKTASAKKAAPKKAAAKKTAPKEGSSKSKKPVIPVEMTAAQKKAAAKAAAKKTGSVRAPRINRTQKPAEVEKLMELSETGAFHVRAEFNDTLVEGRTDNLAESVMSLAPVKLNTKVVFHFTLATDEELAAAAEDTEDAPPFKVVDKVLMIPFARRLFINKMAASIFEKGVKMALGYTDTDGNGEETQ